ncbi:hypothetical protein Tco_0913329 [Tanacetum coccineum]
MEPSPRPSPTTHIPDSIPEDSGGNQGDQAKEIQHLKAHIKKLRSKSHTVITHKSLDEECILEAKIGRKEILEEKIDAKGVWRKRYVVLVEQGKEGKGLVSMQMHFSFDKEKDSTDRTNKGDAIGDDHEDSLETSMVLLARAITQHYSTPTKNRLRTSLNTRNQAIIQVDRVDIQSKNVGNSGRYMKDYCPKPRVCDSKYFQEQMQLAKKDEAGITLDDEQNDFLLVDASEVEEFEDLNAINKQAVILTTGQSMILILLVRIIKSIIDEDKINSDIIFDDPNMEVNNRQVEQDNNDLDQRNAEIESLIKMCKLRLKNNERFLRRCEKIRLKMKGKLNDPKAIEKKVNFVPIDYVKLNKLSETFVPQVELSLEQQYFSKASTFVVTPDKENELTKEVQVMLNVFESMESELDKTLKQNELLNDRLLEATLTHDIVDCVMINFENKNDTLSDEIEKIQNESKDIQENLLESESVSLEFQVQSLTKENEKRVNQKMYAYRDVRSHNQDLLITIFELKEKLKTAEKDPENVEVHIRQNKKTNVTYHVNVVETKDHIANVNAENALKANVNVMCVSCGKCVLTPCHDKCVAKYKLSMNFKVRRALFNSPIVTKSMILDTTPVVAKTRFVVFTPLITKDNVSSASLSTLISK